MMDENLEVLLGMRLCQFIDFIDRFSIFSGLMRTLRMRVRCYWVGCSICLLTDFQFSRMDKNLEYAREVLLSRRLGQFIDRFSIFQDG